MAGDGNVNDRDTQPWVMAGNGILNAWDTQQ
jgi:hypothetical protein